MTGFTASGPTGGAFHVDTGDYAIGVSTVTTAAPAAQVSFAFSVSRRPLWLRVGTAAGEQDVVNDIEFQPGDHVHTFIPTVSPYYVEFQLREAGDAVLSGLTRLAPGIMSLPTPWDPSLFPSLRTEQSLNTQWWGCKTKSPRVLERRANTSWSLRLYQPEDGPFDPDDGSGVTLTPSARTGTATLTASAPVFKTVDTGALIKLTQAGQFETFSASAVSDVTDPIEVTGSGTARTFYYEVAGTFVGTIVLQKSVGSDTAFADVSTFSAPTGLVPLADGLEGQIVYYRLKMTAYTSGAAVMSLTYSGGLTNGVARIFSVDADNLVTVDILTPFASLDATAIWARGSWSDRSGWPGEPCLYDGRLTWFRDDKRWQSEPDDFESFLSGPNDDNAISGSIPGPLNAVRWAKAGERFMFGTSGGEGFLGAGETDDVMTPGNARARVRTERGAYTADAVMIDGSPAFIHRAGRRLLLMVYASGSYNILDLTRLHRNAAGMGNTHFIQLAYQSEPEPRLLAVRSDGQLLTMLINLDERIGGFSRIVPCGTGAAVESVGVNPGTPEDLVYRVVKRTINGVTKRYIEKLAIERWDETNPSAAWRLECALAYSGAAATHITGLGHLEGETVYAWANGRISGPHVVASGAITLSFAATYAIVGMKYQGKYQSPRKQALVDYLKIDKLGIILHNMVRGGVSWGPSFDKMNTLPDRAPADLPDSPLSLTSETLEFPFDGSRDRDPRVCIQFNGVGPGSVLAIAPRNNT